MGELDMTMSDDVIRPASPPSIFSPQQSSPPSIFKQGSVQAFVKQATDIKLFDRKTNRWNWSTLHGLCGEASQAVSQCLRMILEENAKFRPIMPLSTKFSYLLIYALFGVILTTTGLKSVVMYQN